MLMVQLYSAVSVVLFPAKEIVAVAVHELITAG